MIKNVLLTGAGGAIGQHLAEFLINGTDYNLTFSYFTENEIPQSLKENDRLNFVIGDISKKETLEEAFRDVDCLIHLASSVNPEKYSGDWQGAYNFGAESTFAIMDYLKNFEMPLHILFPSSGGTVYNDSDLPHKETELVYGESPYGIQKIMFENYFRLLTKINKNITCNILRISNVYGLHLNKNRKQGFIDISLEKIKNNEPLEIWVPLDTARDYIHIDEVCKHFAKAIEYKNGFEIFNVGSGNTTTIQDLLNKWERDFGRKIDYVVKNVEFSEYFPKTNVLNVDKLKKMD